MLVESYDTSILSEMNDQGIFTLIFHDEEMLRDFKDMVSMFNRNSKQLIVTEIGESGKIFQVGRVDGNPTCWELTMHKYMSYSNAMITDGATGKRHKPVEFTPLRIVISEEPAC